MAFYEGDLNQNKGILFLRNEHRCLLFALITHKLCFQIKLLQVETSSLTYKLNYLFEICKEKTNENYLLLNAVFLYEEMLKTVTGATDFDTVLIFEEILSTRSSEFRMSLNAKNYNFNRSPNLDIAKIGLE